MDTKQELTPQKHTQLLRERFEVMSRCPPLSDVVDPISGAMETDSEWRVWRSNAFNRRALAHELSDAVWRDHCQGITIEEAVKAFIEHKIQIIRRLAGTYW